MGTVHSPAQVKLFCALLVAPTLPLDLKPGGLHRKASGVSISIRAIWTSPK